MTSVRIQHIESFLPDKTLTNEDLSVMFPDWHVDKIFKKTGIKTRHIADENQTALDLGFEAARKVLDSGIIDRDDIDYLLVCTQSPDYFLPSGACILQDRLKLRKSVGALEFNLGCSGFIYGASLARGLIESEQAENVLFVTTDTYSKYLKPADRSVRTIFGDGASATLISKSSGNLGDGKIIHCSFGTDGSGAKHLIVENGAARSGFSGRSVQCLEMNGAEILRFTLETIPQIVSDILEKTKLSISELDHFVFHQANAFILNQLRVKLDIPEEKFCVNMGDYGNTVSATIPMALEKLVKNNSLRRGHKVLLCGFGVGLSWGAIVLEW